MTAAELTAQAGKPTWLNSLPFREPSLYKQIITWLQGYERAGGTAGQKLARLDELAQKVADWKIGNVERGHRKDAAKLRELTALEGQIAQERQALQGERQVELRDARQARGAGGAARGFRRGPARPRPRLPGQRWGVRRRPPGRLPERDAGAHAGAFRQAARQGPADGTCAATGRVRGHPQVADQFEADFERQDNWIRTPQGKVLLRDDGDRQCPRRAARLHGQRQPDAAPLHVPEPERLQRAAQRRQHAAQQRSWAIRSISASRGARARTGASRPR